MEKLSPKINFAIIGVAGFVAPRHLQAIKNIGGELLAAFDISDSVGVLDNYFPDCDFFTSIVTFEKFLKQTKIDYLVVCSPNYLHIEHCLLGLKNDINVICEKPLCLNSNDLKKLQEAEQSSQKQIFTILQLRLHNEIIALKESINPNTFYEGELNYYTPRGNWYFESWKGIETKSGGIATNIGVHFFDMLCWFFGEPQEVIVLQKDAIEAHGIIVYKNAKIKWHLSIDRKLAAKRQIVLNGKEIVFTEGFNHLHTKCYEALINGRGFKIIEIFPSTKIIEQIQAYH
ncbi:MAG: Gfo/Idh/MocA family oxidoreductase [Chitinophagales bacterium]